jgi:hypothetical protein
VSLQISPSFYTGMLAMDMRTSEPRNGAGRKKQEVSKQTIQPHSAEWPSVSSRGSDQVKPACLGGSDEDAEVLRSEVQET